ncbi:MAG: hypothetical protein M5R42_08010 [Rhodocyclaceae bacterium]|nr:hypothetical protein [Rhodocyclaceae bacterium]
MKSKIKHIALALLGATLLAGPSLASGPAKQADQRAPLVLLDAERHIVLEEMRQLPRRAADHHGRPAAPRT